MSEDDYLNPDWINADKVHDWRNYVPEKLMTEWSTFTDNEKRLIAETAEEAAMQEVWD